MGDYADETRTANATSSPDVGSQQRKPLSKGSDGSKPRARQPGEKPRPKQSGVMFDAHRVSDLAAPATSETHDWWLRHAVVVAEAQTALLSAKLDRVLAPEAAITEPCEDIAGAIEMAITHPERLSADPGEIEPLIQRLDTAIGKLYVVARRHHIPMRETHLEEIFDREDQLRKLFTSLGPTHRADNYYDGEIEAVDVTHEAVPTASSIAHELEEGNDASKPRNRDELVDHILGFSNHIRSALDVAYDHAASVIKEPNRPKRPDIIEGLVEIAMTILTAEASAGLGSLLGAALKHAGSAIGAAEHLGEQLTESLVDGLKDGGKELAKAGMGALGNLSPQPPGPDTKLSAKTTFLMAAKQRTANAMDSTSDRFINQKPLLKRVPIAALQGITSALSPALKDKLRTRYSDLIVNEWINFGKAASAEGEEMREPDPHPKFSPYSKLDQLANPWGVLRVTVALDPDANPRLLRAELPGVGDAVLAHVRGEERDLGSLAIHRLIEIAPHDSMSLPGGHFSLDPKGNVSAQPEMLSPAARLKWAQIAKHAVSDMVTDNDVYLGMYALVHWLGGIKCSQIYAGDE